MMEEDNVYPDNYNKLTLTIELQLDFHLFEVVHPFDYLPYAESVLFEYCDGMVIDRTVIMKYPHGARLFIDGKEAGRLRDIFQEVA